MKIKSFLAKPYSKFVLNNENRWIKKPLETQEKVFKSLIKDAKNTQFGKDHRFQEIKNFSDFAKNVPLRDYEGLSSYVDKIREGEKNVLWKEKPLYFAKTSGTTSGAKYIPISKESMPFHIKTAKNALLNYINTTGNANFVDGKMIFLQGTPNMTTENDIQIGRLSGIVAHYVPAYLQKNRLPSWETNCIESWEEKIDRIVEETIGEDLRLISGIPPWVQMYFERIVQKTGKKIGEIFPNFNLFVTGGVNYSPYKNIIDDLVGRTIDVVQTYPASEGFIAYQDQIDKDDLLLQLNNGIFYEFVPLSEINNDKPSRLTLKEVEVGVDYAIILTTNAGLWAYNIGDTVQFTSKEPYRIIVSGRIKHFTSAFGEHVIAKEVEQALKETVSKHSCKVIEFTVAPQIKPESGLPLHEWFIEFDEKPKDEDAFAQDLDTALQNQNTYYKDLIVGKVLRRLEVRWVRKNGFQAYMKSVGKLGGQNKVPRLSNDRKIADALERL